MSLFVCRSGAGLTGSRDPGESDVYRVRPWGRRRRRFRTGNEGRPNDDSRAPLAPSEALVFPARPRSSRRCATARVLYVRRLRHAASGGCGLVGELHCRFANARASSAAPSAPWSCARSDAILVSHDSCSASSRSACRQVSVALRFRKRASPYALPLSTRSACSNC
jgi:hypothetical protein